MSVIQEAFEKLAGLIESDNCLSLILKELVVGDKCIK